MIEIKPLNVFEFDEAILKAAQDVEKYKGAEREIRSRMVLKHIVLEMKYPEVDWNKETQGTAQYVFDKTMEQTTKINEDDIKNFEKPSDGAATANAKSTAKVAKRPAK